MHEVTGPIIATALVLCAVFVPTAFISGLTGQFYKQFALTIAISTVISAFNSLTLSPALPRAAAEAARRAAGPPAARHRLPRSAGSSVRSTASSSAPRMRYVRRRGPRAAASRSSRSCVYGGLIGLTSLGFASVPTGFVPPQDKQYLVAFAQLPDAATLDRTEAVDPPHGRRSR